MATNYPKFDNKIQNQIDLSRMRQAKTRPGVIMQFDKKMLILNRSSELIILN